MKNLFLFTVVLTLFSCKKEVIYQNHCDNSIKGNWSHLDIKFFGSNSFQESQDHHILHVSETEIEEWDATYILEGNEVDIYFPEIDHHESAFFSKNKDTLSISFSNGNVSRYLKN